jgi:hypothetical protein
MRAGIRVQRSRGERAPHNHRVGPSLCSGIGAIRDWGYQRLWLSEIGALRSWRLSGLGHLEARCYSLPPMSGAHFALHAFGADIHPGAALAHGAALAPGVGRLAFNAGNS